MAVSPASRHQIRVCRDYTVGKRDSFVIALFDKGPAHPIFPIFGA